MPYYKEVYNLIAVVTLATFKTDLEKKTREIWRRSLNFSLRLRVKKFDCSHEVKITVETAKFGKNDPLFSMRQILFNFSNIAAISKLNQFIRH